MAGGIIFQRPEDFVAGFFVEAGGLVAEGVEVDAVTPAPARFGLGRGDEVPPDAAPATRRYEDTPGFPPTRSNEYAGSRCNGGIGVMTEPFSRRTFLQGTAAASVAAGVDAAESRRPNILFILTDDQAPWALGRSGNKDAHTPHMDRLFREGAYLMNSFVTTPVCSPSRAGLIASRYGTEVGITDWISPGRNRLRDERHIGLDTSYVTWVELLRDAGYATGLVGKWHLGIQDEHHPTRQGYEYFMGFREGGTKTENPTLEVAGNEAEFEGLTVDILTDHAIEYLRAQDGERPFLLSLHYRSPHGPWKPVADEDWAPYADMEPTLPNPDYPDLDVERVSKLMREYLSSVSGVDRNLGRVLAVLDELGLRDNTIVVYTSDHGYNIGHNGVVHKGNGQWITKSLRGVPGYTSKAARPNMYDNSLRVPTAIRWPGVIEPETRFPFVVSNLDWYPTLLAMTGTPLPSDVTIHGRDFLPVLRGARMSWDNHLYGEYSQHHYTTTHLRMYRTPEWKLVRDFFNEGRDELYHVGVDPAETTNRIDDPHVASIQEELHAKLIAKMESLGDTVHKAAGSA
jgi:arylsulfatase A-like enzyme